MAAEDSASRRRFRWKIGLGILSIAGLITTGSWTYFSGDLTSQVMWLYFVWPAATFLTLLWWTFLSGLRWRTRIAGLSRFLAAVGMWFILFRHKFDGAMIPHPRHRWEHPAWPLATFLLMYVWTFFMPLQWKKRLIGGAAIASVALLAGAGFDGFGVRPIDPDAAYWAALGDGERSKESLAITQRWEDSEVLALAVGIAPRSVFKASAPSPDIHNWPNFRGPFRDGIVRDVTGIRLDWTDENRPKNLWKDKQRIGRGWSSFAVVDGLAVTQEQRGDTETVACYDFATGTQVWTHGDPVRFEKVMGGIGPRTTPTIIGRRVYTLGAKGTLNCLDLVSGSLYWTTNILTDAGAKNLNWGMSGSPLVAGNLVIVNPGIDPKKEAGKAVIAYDRFTGKIAWAAGNDHAGYSSPTIHRIHGVPQLLIFSNDGLIAYDPNTGKELWRYAFTNGERINVTMPIVHGNEILVSSSYHGGSALLQVRVTDGKWSVEESWRKRNFFQLKFNGGIYKDGYVYGLAETILTCIEFETGKRKWRIRGDFGYGQLLLVNETLVVTSENGRVSFVKAEPTKPRNIRSFQALNRNAGTFDPKGGGWNHAVITRGRLLIRNDREVACYDLTGK